MCVTYLLNAVTSSSREHACELGDLGVLSRPPELQIAGRQPSHGNATDSTCKYLHVHCQTHTAQLPLR